MLERELAICMKARVPVLLQAAPGVGKTSIVQDVAKACNRELIAITVSGIEDLYVISKRRNVASYLWNESVVLACSNPQKYVLFMDEVNNVQIMEAIQKLLVPGTNSCGIAIPDDLVIISATNPAELSTTGQALTPPIASRFCILEVSLEESWQAFCDAIERGAFDTSDHDFCIDPAITSIRDVDADVRAAVLDVCRRFASDNAPRFNPDEYHNTVPRTMMYAMRCIQAARVLGVKEDDRALSRVLKGLIRNEDVAALLEALKKRDTLTWDKLLNISAEKLAKYNSAQVSAVISQASFDNLIYVSDDGKSIKTDSRLMNALRAVQSACEREVIETFARAAIRYVIEILNNNRELRISDWDAYESFRSAVS
jgi:replication-associated recombination protein RarA